MLGYHAAPQKASDFSPMFLFFGRHSVILPATRDILAQPLFFAEDGAERSVDEVTALLEKRVAAIRQAGIQVGINLNKAQRRAELRYEQRRNGSFVPKSREFTPGD